MGPQEIEGCMDNLACNYNSEATVDDDNCLENDCDGICGGSAVVDECGVCSGGGVDITTACCLNTGAGLNGEAADCAGVCGGDAVDDACGTCEGSITDATQCDCPGGTVRDCAGECGGNAVEDCAGACNGSAVLTDCGCGEAASDATTGCCADGLGPNDEVQDCAGACGPPHAPAQS